MFAKNPCGLGVVAGIHEAEWLGRSDVGNGAGLPAGVNGVFRRG